MSKQVIGIIGWIAGAIIWAFMAWIYFSEGRTGFAVVQVAICVLFLVHAVRAYLRYKK